MYVNVPSGSGAGVEVGVATDVTIKLNFIGKSGTEFAGQKFSAIDLGGVYTGSVGVTGFSFNTPITGENKVQITSDYVANTGKIIAIMAGTPYEDLFPQSDCQWTVGRIG